MGGGGWGCICSGWGIDRESGVINTELGAQSADHGGER